MLGMLRAIPALVNLENRVLHPVSDLSRIEVNRRKRRMKTDRVDARKLLQMLMRYHGGERKLWSVVNVPSAEAEDERQLNKELAALRIAEKRPDILAELR